MSEETMRLCDTCGHPAGCLSLGHCSNTAEKIAVVEQRLRDVHKSQAAVDGTGLKDSGERRVFATGAQRDRGNKEFRRYDLLPVHAMHRLAEHYGKGAKKYSARNWEKGMPLSEFYNSAMAHALKLAAGYDDEPHMDAWLWNVACFVETRERIRMGLLPAELDDMPTTFSGRAPEF